MSTKKARAEIANREWVEVSIQLDDKNIIQSANWAAWGCHHLSEAADQFTQKIKGVTLDKISWPGLKHWDLLLSEVAIRLKADFIFPIDDPETCHCRKIPTVKVDEAIVLGAHTPERVRAWTTASSGCGTCRPDVEKLIEYRLSLSKK